MINKVLLTLIVAVSMLMAVGAASAASVTPILNDSWTSGTASSECTAVYETYGIGCNDLAYKFDDWGTSSYDGTYYNVDSTGNDITISNNDGYSFDWQSDSEYPVCLVIVKASTKANIYYYPGGSIGDTNLVAPEGRAISHVSFCFTYDDEWNQTDIPEFPTIALPIAAILGLAFYFQRRKE